MSLINLTKIAAVFTNAAKTAANLVNATITAAISYLLKEDGFYLLQETGDRIILEESGVVTNVIKTAA